MKLEQRKTVETIGIWLICVLAVFMLVPFQSVIQSFRDHQKRDATKDELTIFVAEAAKRHDVAMKLLQSGQIYSGADFVRDMTDLRAMLNDIAIPSCTDQAFEKQIDSLAKISKSSYMEKLKKETIKNNVPSSADELLTKAQFEWDRSYNTISDKCKEKLDLTPEQKKARDAELKGLARWAGWFYLAFIPFAAIIVFLRLYCGGRPIRDEVIIRPGRLFLAIFVWPYGVSGFCAGMAAREWRYRRLRVSYLAARGRGYYGLSSEESEILRKRAAEPIANFDALVSEITGEPLVAIAKRSKWAVLATMLGPFATASAVVAAPVEKKTKVVVVTEKESEVAPQKELPKKILSANDSPAIIGAENTAVYQDCIIFFPPDVEAVLLSLHLVWWYDTRPPPVPVNVPDPVPK